MNTSALPSIAIPDEEDTYARPRRWTREEFHRAAEAGIFGENERLELIDGEIYRKMSPQKAPHYDGIRNTADKLEEAFGEEYDVRQQGPLDFGEDDEPEPDVAVVPASWRNRGVHPPAQEVALIVEVADTSVRKDRSVKAATYARSGIPDYWLLNLNNRTLEVRRNPGPLPGAPGGFDYKTVTVYTEDELIAPLAVPAASICVSDLLPPPAKEASSELNGSETTKTPKDTP